ncbi:MAG: 16S rRNA (guanine(966)-N(2))-methyltransferase RsmD [Burkholderiales bacterium]|nr:16S rRNA (guanine(966)-N(2))-methyltransferase RsmD [Burkholderiales bacterium]
MSGGACGCASRVIARLPSRLKPARRASGQHAKCLALRATIPAVTARRPPPRSDRPSTSRPASERSQRASTATRAAPHELRIIGGQWRRSRLPVPDAPGLRPTPDRVRETLFNWLGQDLAGWSVLDAYAGSGALGFEAASRGAARVVMLERDARLAASLRAVRERLQAQAVEVHAADALDWMRRCPQRFGLVLLDPPFTDERLPALQAAAPLLLPDGWLYLESGEPYADADAASLGLALHRAGRAGAVHYHLLRRAGG